MQQCAAKYEEQEDDPFIMSSSRTVDRSIMEAVGLIPAHVSPPGRLEGPRDSNRHILPFRGRHHANQKAESSKRLVRLTMAIAGGLFLIVPMLIMVFVGTRSATISTTCGAIAFAALGLTFAPTLEPKDVLAASAAYAAVLTVFVGTSLPQQGTS